MKEAFSERMAAWLEASREGSDLEQGVWTLLGETLSFGPGPTPRRRET